MSCNWFPYAFCVMVSLVVAPQCVDAVTIHRRFVNGVPAEYADAVRRKYPNAQVGDDSDRFMGAHDKKPIPERSLVVYYCTPQDNVEFVAKEIASKMKADILHIHLKTEYPADLGKAEVLRKKECKGSATPAIVEEDLDLSAYGRVLVGTPVWYGTMAPPIRTFLKTCKLSGQYISMFSTHSGGGIGNCGNDFKRVLTNRKCRIVGVSTFYDFTAQKDVAAIDRYAERIKALK